MSQKDFTKKLQTLTFFLHGFMGTSHDLGYLTEIAKDFGDFLAPDMFLKGSLLSPAPLPVLTKKIAELIKDKNANKNIAFGYSLGGRILFETEKTFPGIFSHLILVSSHPGLLNSKECEERLENDKQLSETLIKHGVSSFLNDWEKKEIFKNTKSFTRNENDFDVEYLANALTQNSLGHQLYDERFISRIADKTTVIIGEFDEKLVNIWTQTKENFPEISLHIVKDAGHRVFLDQPERVAGIFLEVFEGLNL